MKIWPEPSTFQSILHKSSHLQCCRSRPPETEESSPKFPIVARRGLHVETPEEPIHTREVEMAILFTSRLVRESSQETHHLIQDERTPLPPRRDLVHDFIHLPIPKQPLRQSPLHHPQAKGLLMYSFDNFMLCLIHEPGGSNLHSYYGGPVTTE
jgi:hypothetical protein